MEIEATIVVDRPVRTVWNFVAVDHVQNHPRWDPDISLEKISEGPIGVGTIIRRRSARFATPTEGHTEVIEFEPERIMRVKTQDGSVTILGWTNLEESGTDQTRLTMGGDFVGLDEAMADRVKSLLQRSASNIKALIEAET